MRFMNLLSVEEFKRTEGFEVGKSTAATTQFILFNVTYPILRRMLGYINDQ